MPAKKENTSPAKDQSAAAKLHTEGPLGERDEVKEAEHRTAKAQQNTDNVKAELKNRKK